MSNRVYWLRLPQYQTNALAAKSGLSNALIVNLLGIKDSYVDHPTRMTLKHMQVVSSYVSNTLDYT